MCVHGVDDWGKGPGLAAYRLQVDAFEKVISSLSCSRKNSRPEKINEGEMSENKLR